MTSKIAISLAMVFAVCIAPLRLPAQSCILSNAASEKACQPDCCANKTCCATSPKNVVPASQPLAKNSPGPELNAICPVVSSAILSYHGTATQPVAFANAASSAQSPPTPALLCTFLI